MSDHWTASFGPLCEAGTIIPIVGGVADGDSHVMPYDANNGTKWVFKRAGRHSMYRLFHKAGEWRLFKVKRRKPLKPTGRAIGGPGDGQPLRLSKKSVGETLSWPTADDDGRFRQNTYKIYEQQDGSINAISLQMLQ